MMKKGMNIIEAAMKHYQIVVTIVAVMMVVGIVGLKNMPRREFPEFTIRQGVIVGVFPGHSSLEVEEQLTTVVEDYIFGYEEVKKSKTYSHSTEGQMIIYVELNDNVKNADKFWSKLRHGLSELKMSLPSGVLALIGNNEFGDTSALLITMSSEKKSYRELQDIMKDLEAEIRKIPEVSKIKRYGEQKEEIYVYIKPEKLKEFNLKPTNILASFQLQESINYSGTLDNGDLILPIHLPPRFESEKELEEQIIYSDPLGNTIRLKDVAYIERRYEKPENYVRNNGNNALVLSLEMQKGNNIVQFGDAVNELLVKFSEKNDEDVKLNVISSLPDVVNDSITHFLKEFLIAIVAVIIVTMVLLPFRVATVAAVSIPISILITIGIMQLVGIQLHIVSLAALIVVLGMVVDNAIVVIDNHVEKLDHGENPWDAAWKSATELFIPVLSASAAISVAFFPLLFFLTGIADDFVGSLPVTIGIALLISMLVAVLLVPFMCFIFIKKGLHNHENDHKNEKQSALDYLQKWFDYALEKCFKHPVLTIVMGILSVVVGVLFFMNIDQKLFPEMDRKQFAIEVYLPEGSSVSKTESVIDSLETILSKDERITNIASFIGNGSPRFNALYAPHLPAKNYGQLLLNTISNEATIDIINEYSEKYKNAFPKAHVKWKQLAMESFKAPIEIRIASNNIKDLKEISEQVANILNENEDVDWVRTDWNEKRQGISVELIKSKANQLGYAKSLVASSLLISLDGLPLTTIWEGDYPLTVLLSREDYQKNSVNDLENQYITSPLTLESLPLRSIGKLKPEWTEGTIVRRNGVRTLTVLADVERGKIPSKIFNKKVRPQIEDLQLPDGMSITYGGDYEASVENFIPMTYSLAISVVLIFFILMFQFKTIRKALLIMSTMLLSIFGAGLGLLLMNYPFSLTSFIGVMGLMGITVRNGIILIDYASQLVHNHGMTYEKAALAAGKRRMRPIFLTSAAAAVGVIPMIISKSPLWGPLGTVICFGLLAGMVLTLLVLPVLYWKSIGKAAERAAKKASSN